MYTSILLAVDLNDPHSWEKALPTAVALCQSFGAKLHVTTVVPDFGMSMVGQFFPADYEAKVRDAHDQQLTELIENEVPKEVACTLSVLEGKIYQEILHAAAAVAADLIVMNSHKPELKDYLLGPNAARVVRHATCSVMVVRD